MDSHDLNKIILENWVLDLAHSPVLKKVEKIIFRKLDVFPLSPENGHRSSFRNVMFLSF
jgi:hypothetical protein